MPAGDGVWRGGWDGYVEHVDGNAHLPHGALCWEMGNVRRVRLKAQQDYTKRTARPGEVVPAHTTFVFATMRHWPNKREWAAARRAEGLWRDVRVLDSDDLWAWLESNPDIHAWMSEQMGARLGGPSKAPAPAQLPADAVNFVGREDELIGLSTIAQHISGGGLVVITGQPGVGKTTLAVRFAHDHAAGYPDGQLYVDLRGTHDDAVAVDALLERVLGSLGVSLAASSSHVDEMTAAYRTLAADKRFILVLDNAADEQQVRPLIPGTSRSLVVVTSRDHLGGLDCHRRIHLDVLSKSEAAALLAHGVGVDRAEAEHDALGEIAGLCGHLPLALRIAARLAERSPTWRLAYLVERLRDERSRLDRLKSGDLAVRASFQLSYDLLAHEQQVTFRRLCLVPGATFGIDLVMSALGIKKQSRAESMLDELVDRNLLELAPQEGRYRLHDLLRLFGEERVEEDETDASRLDVLRSARTYLLRTSMKSTMALLGGTARGAGVGGKKSVSPRDALRWLDLNFDNVMAVARQAAVEGFYNEAINPIVQLSGYLELRAAWTPLRELAELGLEIVHRVEDKGSAVESGRTFVYVSMCTLLAKSAHGLRDYDRALAYCDQADDWCGGQPVLSHMINQVRAQVMRSMNRFDEALALDRVIEDFYKELDAPDRLGIIEHNIGATLMDAGRYEEALEYLHRDLAGCRQRGDEFGVAHTLNTIGIAWGRLGVVEKSKNMLIEAALAYRSRGERLREGYALNDLGILLCGQGDFINAFSCHVLDLEYCIEGEDLHGAAQALVRLAENVVAHDVRHAHVAVDFVCHALRCLNNGTDRHAIAAALVVLGEIGYVARQYEYADAQYDMAFGMYVDVNSYEGQFEVFLKQTRDMVEHGRRGQAVRHLRVAVDLARSHDRARDEAYFSFCLAKLLVDSDTEEAKRLLARSARLLGELPAIETPTSTGGGDSLE